MHKTIGKWSSGHLAEQWRQSAHPPDTQLSSGHRHSSRQPYGECRHLPGQPRGEVAECLAREYDLAGDAVVAATCGQEKGAAPVAVNQSDVVQVEGVQEVRHDPDLTVDGQVGICRHGCPVRSER